ncbi:MAG: ATP-binding cassette domain-containing protein [Rhizobiaceae bacterium]|nr:ATP-binding cassette domain-containing protein [Rhizobiaceae bacterium]
MAPPLLTLTDIHLTFGSTPLFTGADMAVHARERLCLVGRNGSGKSTLLKIAAGELEFDQGERFFQPGTTVRYLPQEPDFSAYATVMDYVEAGLEEADDPYRAQLLLQALGLTGEELTSNLSGGEARRAALVRTLAPEPDILLLDEPTNHLDLPAIEWLEKEIAGMRSAVVMISHDRRFLENLSRSTLWVDRGQSRLLEKSFAHFEDWRDTLLEQEQLDAHKLDRKIVREEHWVTHGVSGRRKRNMKRLGDLGKLRQQRADRLKPTGDVAISVVAGEASGKLVARVEKISKSYGDRVLVKDFSTRIARGDRLGLVGPNGIGKTTLVKMLTGQLPPDTGTVKPGANIEMLIVDQQRTALAADLTVKDALTGGGTDVVAIGDTRKHVMAYMKDFLFLPEQARTPVSRLSGGERGRLMLAMQLRHPSNLLVLDEPTNDLDLETLDLLQEMIADYRGTVIVVSHDRDFLDRVCTSIIAPQENGAWVEYAGGYSDMISQSGGGTRNGKISGATSAVSTGSKNHSTMLSPSPSSSSPPRSPPSSPRAASKLSFKDKHALQALPGEIEKLEGDIAKVNKALAEDGLFDRDAKRFGKLVRLLEKTQSELDQKEQRWLELEMLQEELEG